MQSGKFTGMGMKNPQRGISADFNDLYQLNKQTPNESQNQGNDHGNDARSHANVNVGFLVFAVGNGKQREDCAGKIHDFPVNST